MVTSASSASAYDGGGHTIGEVYGSALAVLAETAAT